MAYTPEPYMDHTHPQAFLDWTKRSPEYGSTKECPRCKGFGGWNLLVNAYSMPPNTPDTPENRHRFVHFRAMCGHCHGWGYVSPEVTCTGHDWVWLQNLGRCFNRYKCKHCGATSDVDSGD